MKKFLTLLTALLIISYPFIIYFGLMHFSVRYLAIVIAFIFLLRFVLFKSSHSGVKKTLLILATLLGIAVSLIGLISNEILIIKLYPFMMSLLMLSFFSYSLFYPPTIIERLARITNPNLPSHAIHYTNIVTRVWCLFFFINGLIALWTTFYTSMRIWTLYNGFLSYILMGILFISEFIIRQRVKQRYFT